MSAALRLLLLLLLFSCVADRCQGQGKLADPFPVLDGGKPLDVKLHGAAAPWLVDFNQDGSHDLLVGEGYRGRLRIYLNHGSSAAPRFDGYSLFKDGMPEGCVPRNNGFCPVFADLDQDGMDDLLTPAWYGHVRWFRQERPAEFAAAQPILNQSDEMIQLEWTHGVTTCDWDNDNHVDLLVGSHDHATGSNIFLFRNAGVSGHPRFQDPVAIMANEQTMVVAGQAPAPAAADWDGDGVFDLIVGTYDGNVVWYRNHGSPGDPIFKDAEQLIPPQKADDLRGGNAVVSVGDWNADGRLDLVVGDTGERFENKLTREDVAEKSRAQASQEQSFTDWARVYRTYRRLKQLPLAESTKALLDAARRQLVEKKDEQTLHYLEQTAIFEGRQHHGRVWVFLRED